MPTWCLRRFYVGLKMFFLQLVLLFYFLSRLYEVVPVLRLSDGEHYLLPFRRRDDPWGPASNRKCSPAVRIRVFSARALLLLA